MDNRLPLSNLSYCWFFLFVSQKSHGGKTLDKNPYGSNNMEINKSDRGRTDRGEEKKQVARGLTKCGVTTSCLSARHMWGESGSPTVMAKPNHKIRLREGRRVRPERLEEPCNVESRAVENMPRAGRPTNTSGKGPHASHITKPYHHPPKRARARGLAYDDGDREFARIREGEPGTGRPKRPRAKLESKPRAATSQRGK